MAPVLKTGEVRASVGSNPTPSVQSITAKPCCIKGFRSSFDSQFCACGCWAALLRLVFRVQQQRQVLALVQLFDLFTGVG